MSGWTGKLFYLLVTALLFAAAYGYAKGRDLEARYAGHLEDKANVQAAEETLEAVDHDLERTRRKVAGLEDDPLEIEATIRKISRGVRDGETVYTLDGFPDTVAEAEKLVGRTGDTSHTWEPN